MSNTTLGTALLALIERDLKLAYRHRGALAYPVSYTHLTLPTNREV